MKYLYTDKRSYHHFEYLGDPFAMSSELVIELNGVKLTKHYLAYAEKDVSLVYFIDGTNGDHYGQFPELNQALDRFHFLKKVPENERRQYDR